VKSGGSEVGEAEPVERDASEHIIHRAAARALLLATAPFVAAKVPRRTFAAWRNRKKQLNHQIRGAESAHG
jgi:hypothetical protein